MQAGRRNACPAAGITSEDDRRERIIISSALGVPFVLLALLLRTVSRTFDRVIWGMDETHLCSSLL